VLILRFKLITAACAALRCASSVCLVISCKGDVVQGELIMSDVPYVGGVPGDLTEDEVKKRSLKELRGQLLGAAHVTRQVTIEPAAAAILLELLPADEEEEDGK
jgi:hypothetical protein